MPYLVRKIFNICEVMVKVSLVEWASLGQIINVLLSSTSDCE